MHLQIEVPNARKPWMSVFRRQVEEHRWPVRPDVRIWHTTDPFGDTQVEVRFPDISKAEEANVERMIGLFAIENFGDPVYLKRK